MKQSPYQTFACTGYELEKITQEVQRELLIDSHSSMADLGNQLGEETLALFSNIKFNPKPFAHPIDIAADKTKGEYARDRVLIDIRPFTKVSRHALYDITKHSEFELAKRRAILHSIWRSSDSFLIQNALSPLNQIYASWISESLSRHLSVDAFTQLKIANIATWWFWCQRNKPEDLNENSRAKIYREIAEATRSGFDTVEQDLDGIEYFDDLEVFCNEVKERTGSPSLKHLDPASVIQLCSNGWMGTWSKEIMSVAIEYPPYFTAVVFTALYDRGTRSAQFSKFVQRFMSRQEIKGFLNTINRLSTGENETTPMTR